MSFELRAIAPKGQYDDKLMRKLWQKAIKKTTDRAKRRYEKTTKTWTKRPKFRVKSRTRRGELVASVYTDDALYAIIDQGAKPHKIRARRSQFLRFKGGPYGAKTTPDVINSTQGSKSDGDWVTRQEVDHPGHKPRNFSKIIAKETQREMQTNVSQALGEWVRRTKG